MTQRVGLEFDGRATGAVAAGRQTAAAVEKVRREARQARGDFQALDRDIGKTVRGVVAGSGAFRGLGRSIAFASTGFLGGYGLTAAISGAIGELNASIKVAAQTNAALRSTGAVAGITARQIDELAQSLMRKSGVDDEAIKSSENLLLTFTNVRNEAGKGNDIFNQATRAILDMSVAMGTDLTSTTIQVGKALQDPIRGMTALRRVGVAFTREQEEQVKRLVATGRAMDAQKMILRELIREFGGSAKAAGDAAPWNRLRETIRNLSADLLTGLSPQIRSVTGRMQAWVDEQSKSGDLQRKVNTAVKDGTEIVKGAITVGKELAGVANGVAGAVGGWKNATEGLIALKLVSTLNVWRVAMLRLIGTEAAAGAAGTGVAGAAASVGRLRAGLLALSRLAAPIAITVAVEVLLHRKWIGDKIGDIIDKAIGAKPEVGTIGPGAGGGLAGVVVDAIRDMANRGQTPAQIRAALARQGIAASAAQIRQAIAGTTSGVQAGLSAARTGTAAGIIATARAVARGPFNEYVYGGGHGAVPGPTTALGTRHDSYKFPGFDCSGFVRYVMAQNGITVPGTSQAQAAGGIPVAMNELLPGDLVFSDGWPHPGHVAIYIGNGKVIEDPHTGASIREASVRGFQHACRYFKSSDKAKTGGFTPLKPGDFSQPGAGASTSPIPAAIRLAISQADAAAAGAALTPGKTDDRAAIARQKAALDQEIAWLRSRLNTNLGAEKRITLTDILTGALTDRAQLAKTKAGAKGAGIGTITSLRETINEQLAAVGTATSPAVTAAMAKLQQLRDHLKVGLTAKDLAATRASIRHWGTVLKDAVTKAGEVAQAAAAEAARNWQQTWQSDVTKVLRGFDERVAQPQLKAFQRATDAHIKEMQRTLQTQFDAFDQATQKGLTALAAPGETPAERALREFQAGRSSAQEARARQQLQDEIAKTQAELAQLGPGGTPGTGGSLVVDVGLQTSSLTEGVAGTAGMTPEEITAKREDLLKQLREQQQQYDDLALDDQEKALQTAADASRKAAEEKAQADQDAYQKDRDRQRQALQDKEDDLEQHYSDQRDAELQAIQDHLDDQRTGLEQDLADWQTWLEAKKKSYQAFLDWLAGKGVDTSGLQNPAGGGATGVSGALFTGGQQQASVAALIAARGGRTLAFQHGGSFVVRRPTVLPHMLVGEGGQPERVRVEPLGRERPTVVIENLTVLGTTASEVQRALARIVNGAPVVDGYSVTGR